MRWSLRWIQILLAASCTFACVSVRAGEVLLESFRSQILNRDYKYAVYLPDGYDKDKRRYPVLYLLHGTGADENAWLQKGGLRETMDALQARRLIHPMIVVMPGDTHGDWVDGMREKSETALLKEVMPHAESKYSIDGQRANRLVAGLSAGGRGALNLVIAGPSMFAAAAIQSPAIYDPVPPSNSSAMRHPQFQVDGRFDAETWRRLNYTSRLDSYLKSGLIVPLYITSGDHDRFGIALQSAMLYERLRLHQPKDIELRIIDGDHEWAVWRDTLADALQFMSSRIAGPR